MTERLAVHDKFRVDVLENTNDRSIVFFDLETTGKYPKAARIVSFAAFKISLSETGKVIEETISLIINPEMKIDKGASDIHGILNEDLVNAPTFAKCAELICKFMKGCIVIGYNNHDYDQIVFMSEIIRNSKALQDIDFDMGNQVWVDCMKIWWETNKLCSGKLDQCHKHYTGTEHTGAHNALDDINATYNIFFCQIQKHKHYRGWYEGASAYPFDTYNWDAMEGVRPWFKGDKYFEPAIPVIAVPSNDSHGQKKEGGEFDKFLTPTPYGNGSKDFIINCGKQAYRGRALSEIKTDAILAESIVWYATSDDGYKADGKAAKDFVLDKTKEFLIEAPVKHLLKISRELQKSCNNKTAAKKITWFYNLLLESNRESSPTMQSFVTWAKQNSFIT